MIKFFRRIRQKLIEEGKLKKYLIYAIGEILLVMIGILMALQINNWNQSKIDRATEQEYYIKFLEDVTLDEALTTNEISKTKKRLINANQLIYELQSERDDMNIIAKYVLGAVAKANVELSPTQTTYDDVKSSGNVNLIKDTKLKRHLDTYYANTSGLMNTINVNSHRLGTNMFSNDDKIGTGLFHLTKMQNGFDTTLVNIQKLEKLGRLTPTNRKTLLNNGITYTSLTSRNLQHLEVLLEIIGTMKEELEKKCSEK